MNEIEALFCKLLNCDRSSLYLDKHRSLLDEKHFQKLQLLLKKRMSGEPLQYLLGDTEFMGLVFKVRRGVLIPRPETGILVEEALKKAKACGKDKVSFLDIGTGSGNIAVCLAKFFSKSKITAVDISDLCLSVAEKNAQLNGVEKKIKFLKSDLFECFKGRNISFDFIVSNPPYISVGEYAALPQDVLREPKEALLAEEEGFSFYRRIIDEAGKFLVSGGEVLLEIGDEMSEAVKKMFLANEIWRDFQLREDYNGIKRVFAAKRI